MSSGQLYLIPTYLAADAGYSTSFPEENKNIIKALDYFLVEEIRSARRFISGLKLGLVIENLEFVELSKKTPDDKIKQLIKPILEGRSCGIISEAGLPGVADPGSRAVLMAHKNGIKVRPLVGPSSIFLALMASGLNGQSFKFLGYLPINKNEREKAIQNIEKEANNTGTAQIFMETPYRNNQMVETILEICKDESLLTLAADITAPSEYIRTQKIKDWKYKQPDLHKKPCIFIIQ